MPAAQAAAQAALAGSSSAATGAALSSPAAVTPVVVAQPSSLSRLSLQDKLLLAQAVHHVGSTPPDWSRVSSLLLSHPLIKTQPRIEAANRAGFTLGRVFGSRECERAWVALMRTYGLVLQPGEDSDEGVMGTGRPKEARGFPPRMDRGSQLVLAQMLYAERMKELHASIKEKEDRFKELASEIDALKSGARDAVLSAELKAQYGSTTSASRQRGTLPPLAAAAVEEEPLPSPRAVRERTRTAAAESRKDDTTTGKRTTAAASSEPKDDAAITPSSSSNKKAEAAKGAAGTDAKKQSEAMDVDQPEGAAAKADASKSGADKGEAEDEEEAESRAAAASRSSKRKRPSDAGTGTSEVEDEARDSRSGTPQAASKSRKRTRALTITTQPDETINEDEAPPTPLRGAKARTRTGTAATTDDDAAAAASSASARRTRRRIAGEDSAPPTPATATRTRSTRASASREPSAPADEGGDASRSTLDEGADEEDEEGDTSGPLQRSPSLSPISSRKGTSRAGRGRASSAASKDSRDRRRTSGKPEEPRDEASVEREKAKRRMEKMLLMLLDEVSNHTHGNLFHNPINVKEAPDYYTLIRHPVDIKTIKVRVKEGQITSLSQMRKALTLMFANALIYNRPGTEVHRMASEMRDAAELMILRFEQMPNMIAASRR